MASWRRPLDYSLPYKWALVIFESPASVVDLEGENLSHYDLFPLFSVQIVQIGNQIELQHLPINKIRQAGVLTSLFNSGVGFLTGCVHFFP